MVRTQARYAPMLVEAGDLEVVAAPLCGELHSDICIVGGGYLGLWTAIRLLEAEPSLSISIVEADICGGGASGRNSGMALAWWPKFEALAAACGTEEALRLCRESENAISEIEVFCAANGIDAEFARYGWLWGATCSRQDGRWMPVINALARHGLSPFRILDRNAVRQLVDVPGYSSGVFDATAGSIQPGKLVRGLRRVAEAMGAKIYENSPMICLVRGNRPAVLTPRGRMNANQVVLAMNAWSLAFPELRRGIFVITSDDVITEPAKDLIARHHWRDGPIITNSAMFVSGYRPTRDGRIVAGVTGGKIGFGSLAGQRFEGPSPREKEISDLLVSALQDVDHPRLASSWRGPIDRTRTGLPLFGPLPGQHRIYFGYGFSGNGIVGCYIGARILASVILQRKDEWTATGLIRPPEPWMPPEPIRYAGAHLVKWAVQQKDRFDALNKNQSWLGAKLASFAPGGIVTTRMS